MSNISTIVRTTEAYGNFMNPLLPNPIVEVENGDVNQDATIDAEPVTQRPRAIDLTIFRFAQRPRAMNLMTTHLPSPAEVLQARIGLQRPRFSAFVMNKLAIISAFVGVSMVVGAAAATAVHRDKVYAPVVAVLVSFSFVLGIVAYDLFYQLKN